MSQKDSPVLRPRKIWKQFALPLLLLAPIVITGCGGRSHSSGTTGHTPTTISFSSSRALDGSDQQICNIQLFGCPPVSNIWVMNFDGSNARPVTKFSIADSFQAAWSSDGSKLAFTSTRALDGSDSVHASNIWVINADGSGPTPLTRYSTVVGVFDPVWSPDGKKLAFVSAAAVDGSDALGPNSRTNIWVVNADGSGRTPLTKLISGLAGSPAWSPDGSKIAFAANRALDGSDVFTVASNIWVMNADGSGAVAVTKLSISDCENPRWSPDSSKLAFNSNQSLTGPFNNLNQNVWVMNADGSGIMPLTRISANSADSGAPVWSPDGKKLAFVSSRALDGSNAPDCTPTSVGGFCLNPVSNIWVVNPDGSGAMPLTRLTVASANSRNPAWAPDSSRVAFESMRALDGSNAAGTGTDIWVVNPNASGATALTKLNSSANVSPQWHP